MYVLVNIYQTKLHSYIRLCSLCGLLWVHDWLQNMYYAMYLKIFVKQHCFQVQPLTYIRSILWNYRCMKNKKGIQPNMGCLGSSNNETLLPVEPFSLYTVYRRSPYFVIFGTKWNHEIQGIPKCETLFSTKPPNWGQKIF